MPRKLRLEFPGAMYHIMSRGDQREDIFLCDVDRWSSFPLYLRSPEHRPQWLRADRLLGEHGIQGDTPAGRQEYERQMERRRLEEVDEDKLEEFRHAWFLDTNRSTIQPPPTPSFNLGSDELCTENILFYGLTPP